MYINIQTNSEKKSMCLYALVIYTNISFPRQGLEAVSPDTCSQIQVEYRLFKMLGTRNVFRFFRQNTCINVRYLEDKPKYKHRIHFYFMYTLSTMSEGNFAQQFWCICSLNAPWNEKSSVPSCQLSKSPKILEHVRFHWHQE